MLSSPRKVVARMGPMDTPPRKVSPSKAADASPSWNLKETNTSKVNLEVNEVNTIFQINKKLDTSPEDDIDATKEVENVVSETASRLKKEAQRVEEFQKKTKMRARVARLKEKENELKKVEEKIVTKNKVQEVAAKVKRPNSAPATKIGITRREPLSTLRPPKSAEGTRPSKAKPKFKGKGPVMASSTDSNPWDYTPPKDKPKATRVSAEESILQEAQAASEADEAAKKARDLAAARVKVAMAKSKEVRVKREAAEAVKKPVRKVSRPLSAPKTVYSTTAKDQYRDRLNKRLADEQRLREKEAEAEVVDPTMVPAFDALKACTRDQREEYANLTTPPSVIMRICEGICVLVGEEPGWVTMRRLLSRRDFLPTLAMCSAERIPMARVKKFRAQTDFPTIKEAEQFTGVGLALCMWAWAIDATADQETVSLSSSATVSALAEAVSGLRGSGAPKSADYRAREEQQLQQGPEQEPANAPTAPTAPTSPRFFAPTLEEAFAALELITKRDRMELCRAKEGIASVKVIMAAVCVLVGEEPGWQMSCRLLARPDFIPTLSSCGPDRIPLGRIKKFRAQLLPAFPDLEFVKGISSVGYAMGLWVLAINGAFPLVEKPSTQPPPAKKETNYVQKNSLKAPARRVPTPQRAKEMALALAKTAEAMPEGTVDKSEPWQELVKKFVGNEDSGSSEVAAP